MKMPFIMHKGMLCNVAPYFKAALDGSFSEAKNRVLELPDDNAVAFKRFQLWVYTKKILEEGEREDAIKRKTLAKLYFFGEVRGIPDLQNAAIDVLMDKVRGTNTVPPGYLRLIYENTPDGSPLRRLYVDLMASSARCEPKVFEFKKWFDDIPHEDLPHAFLIDLVIALVTQKEPMKLGKAAFLSARASYHVNPHAVASSSSVVGDKASWICGPDESPLSTKISDNDFISASNVDSMVQIDGDIV